MQHDHIKYAVAYATILAFVFCVGAVVYIDIPQDNRELFIHTLGMVEGAFIGTLLAYYYTKSSSDKKGDSGKEGQKQQ